MKKKKKEKNAGCHTMLLSSVKKVGGVFHPHVVIVTIAHPNTNPE